MYLYFFFCAMIFTLFGTTQTLCYISKQYCLLQLLTDPVYPGLFYKHLRHSLIHWLSQPFPQPSLPNHLRASELNLWENVHPQPHVTCHMSVPRVTCPMSCVTCHVSYLMCHMSCGDNRWRVCYQLGLRRLVFYSYPCELCKIFWWSMIPFLFCIHHNSFWFVLKQWPQGQSGSGLAARNGTLVLCPICCWHNHNVLLQFNFVEI